ncbi:glycosyltransferase [Algoriphagus zhangzhouensis]|uniref:Glycosyltransferase involved in cell wall bisynthesis n=1 Tax=Algoriphagus zhangzhouensis TaxID=1073327 RepID=A0A1M7Z5L9_9BACT|nr:glycosyltransferase [Algoriphagus zhangzhouensis]TDY48970.1 glycosyltransferase involved in cell wall biosynthesis [Algoriphagus zhangzhouensis]SHO60233.1 Glycosyltransferase involved in cell wall bisynthesis [Algoriphagus zhangzhouensis]
MSDLTILIPIFNEEEGIERIPQAFEPYLRETDLEVEVLLINDGSTDGSLEKIIKVCRDNPQFNFISFSKNCGLSAALFTGFQHVTSKWVGYIDGDLQTDPLDFLKLEPFRIEYELVTGYRANRKDTWVKRQTSSIANGFRNWVLADGVRDSGCPLKIIQTKSAKRLTPFKGMHRFFPALIQIQGGKVKELPVNHFPRISGESKFGFNNRLFGPIRDMFAVRWMKKRKLGLPKNSEISQEKTHLIS